MPSSTTVHFNGCHSVATQYRLPTRSSCRHAFQMGWAFPAPRLMPSHWQRLLENVLEKVFPISGTPSTVLVKEAPTSLSKWKKPYKLWGVITDPITLNHLERLRELMEKLDSSRTSFYHTELNKLMRIITIFMSLCLKQCWFLNFFVFQT